VQSPNGNHLSGLVWGSTKPEIVLVHDLGDSSNGWDGVALALTRDAVALDLPGHGRSSEAASIAPPARQAPSLVDAIRSLAPTASLVVATGFGAAVAVHAVFKRLSPVKALLVIDGGAFAAGASPLVDPDGFNDVDEAARRLAAAAPRRHPAFVQHLAAETTVPDPDGRPAWRYQLGAPPDDVSAWWSFQSFDAIPIPLAVATAAGGPARDPVVQSILDHWPNTARLAIDATGDDLAGAAPLAVAATIDRYVNELTRPPNQGEVDP
jgi:pimeloyl-ACP methyl ester carboxylesterase